MAGQINVVFKDNKWKVKPGGNARSIKNFDTKKAAVQKGKIEAKKRNTELLIHNKNGQIAIKNSYGNDPRSIKG